MEDISAVEFLELLKEKRTAIIDVREPLEYHTYNLGGINIPLGKLPFLLDEEELNLDKNKEIIVLCQRGLRSNTAKNILQNAGYKKVRNLLGGLAQLQKV